MVICFFKKIFKSSTFLMYFYQNIFLRFFLPVLRSDGLANMHCAFWSCCPLFFFFSKLVSYTTFFRCLLIEELQKTVCRSLCIFSWYDSTCFYSYLIGVSSEEIQHAVNTANFSPSAENSLKILRKLAKSGCGIVGLVIESHLICGTKKNRNSLSSLLVAYCAAYFRGSGGSQETWLQICSWRRKILLRGTTKFCSCRVCGSSNSCNLWRSQKIWLHTIRSVERTVSVYILSIL